MDCKLYEKEISRYAEEHIGELLESLRGLMRIPSVAEKSDGECPFGKGSAEALGYIKQLAESFSLKTRGFSNYAVTADLGEGEPELGILAHVDVVAQGEGWTKPCFDLTVENGRAYGRGAIDDKGPAVAALYAVKAVAELGITLKSSVRCIFGGGEELGCEDIAYYSKCEALPEKVITPDGEFPIVNAEKGMLHLRAGASRSAGGRLVSLQSGSAVNAIPAKAVATLTNTSMDEILEAVSAAGTNAKFSLQQRGSCIEITALGKAAHGSRPNLGVNALTALLAALAKLDIAEAKELSGLFPYGQDGGEGFGLCMSDEMSGGLTFALTVCSIEGESINIGADCRFPVSGKLGEISGVVEERLRSAGFDIYENEGMEPHYVPENSSFIDSLKRAYESVTGERAECLCETGVTYAHSTEGGVAFGAEVRGEDNAMHSADESISLERLKMLVRVYAAAIIEICG